MRSRKRSPTFRNQSAVLNSEINKCGVDGDGSVVCVFVLNSFELIFGRFNVEFL